MEVFLCMEFSRSRMMETELFGLHCDTYATIVAWIPENLSMNECLAFAIEAKVYQPDT